MLALNSYKTKRIIRILLAILLMMAGNILADGIIPVGRVEYDFVYDRLEREETRSLDRFDYQLGPYQISDSSQALFPFGYLSNLGQNRLGLFSFAGEDFHSQKEARASAYETVRGGLVARPHPKLFVYGNFVLDEAMAKSATYTGKKWRGLAGSVENAFINYRHSIFDFTLGRFSSFWGPRNSLVLGANVAMDGFGYSIRWGKLSLSYRLARLDGLSPDADSTLQFENRYFAGHRLDIHLKDNLRLGFFETVIFGGPGRQIDLFYLNPILFFHADQLNEFVDDNTFMGIDFTYKPKTGWKLYGQLIVDDFQVDNKELADNEPNEIAFMLGSYAVNIIDATDLRIEYTRVTNRTFNQSHERNRYTFKNELIGSALGNDYDLFSSNITRWLNSNLNIGLNISYMRQGEGRVSAEWDTPWMETEGDYFESFPTGTVWSTAKLSLSTSGFVSDFLFFALEGGIEPHKNYQNINSDDRTLPFALIKLSTFFNSLISVE